MPATLGAISNAVAATALMCRPSPSSAIATSSAGTDAERGQREAEQEQAVAQTARPVAVQPGVGGQAPRALHDARLALLAGGQGLRERGVVAQRRVGLEIPSRPR